VTFKDGNFELIPVETPKPPAGKVLVKVAYSAIQPYDLYLYNIGGRTEGFTLGAEGSGVVVEVGEGVDESLKGKKVAFVSGGWATYTIADPDWLLVFDDSVELDQIALAWINPMTAVA
jgi:NADPH:quinone reductase-like Zn-dependent oxidoreductase